MAEVKKSPQSTLWTVLLIVLIALLLVLFIARQNAVRGTRPDNGRDTTLVPGAKPPSDTQRSDTGSPQ